MFVKKAEGVFDDGISRLDNLLNIVGLKVHDDEEESLDFIDTEEIPEQIIEDDAWPVEASYESQSEEKSQLLAWPVYPLHHQERSYLPHQRHEVTDRIEMSLSAVISMTNKA